MAKTTAQEIVDVEHAPKSAADLKLDAEGEAGAAPEAGSEEALLAAISEHVDTVTGDKEAGKTEDEDGDEKAAAETAQEKAAKEKEAKAAAATKAKGKEAQDRINNLKKKDPDALTAEEKEEIGDYILDRFKGKPQPGREAAKSYFFAEKLISKQGQQIAAQRQKIQVLEKHIGYLKENGLDTRDAEAALDSSYTDMAKALEAGKQAGNTAGKGKVPGQPENPFLKAIDERIARHITPIQAQAAKQAMLERDAMTINTLRETYEDYGELEPIIAEVIRSRAIDLTADDKIEKAYIMAKGIKAHRDAIAGKSRTEAAAAAAKKKAAKDAAKADGYVEGAAGAGEGAETEGSYLTELDKATTDGSIEALARFYAKYHME